MSDIRNDRATDRYERARAAASSDEHERRAAAPPPEKNAKDIAWDIGESLLHEISYACSASGPVQAIHAADNLATAASADGEPKRLDEVRGVRLFALVEKELPKTDHDGGVLKDTAGDYKLRPQIAKDAAGHESIAYYVAVRHGRPEFAVGKNSLQDFMQHHEMYEQLAAHSRGLASARPYEKDTYQTAELVRQGELVEAAKKNLRGWDHAYSDPVWALQQAVNLGSAMAPAAGATHATHATEAAPVASEPSESAPLLRRQYQPTTTADPSMPKGTGGTDKYGNFTYSTAGTPTDVALVRAHESVHSFLSPKALNGLREFRADARMAAYQKSALCQYLEEALAESYAQAKVNGVTSIPAGVAFPIRAGYVTLERVVTEAAIGTIAYGGVLYGVYLVVDK